MLWIKTQTKDNSKKSQKIPLALPRHDKQQKMQRSKREKIKEVSIIELI